MSTAAGADQMQARSKARVQRYRTRQREKTLARLECWVPLRVITAVRKMAKFCNISIHTFVSDALVKHHDRTRAELVARGLIKS